MLKRWRLIAGLSCSLMLFPSLAACSGASGDPNSGGSSDGVTISSRDEEAEIAVGEKLVIDMGSVNSSIGDSWDISFESNPGILSEVESSAEYAPGDEDLDGVSFGLKYVLLGEKPGTAEIVLKYEYRGKPKADTPDRHITVTVVG